MGAKMKLMSCFVLLLFIINRVTCIQYINVTNENVPYSFKTPLWQAIFQKIEEKKNLLPFKFTSNDSELKANATKQCIACNVIASAVLMERSFEMTNIQLSAEFSYFCELLGIEKDPKVCEGVVDLNVEAIGYILDNTNITSQRICSLLLECESGSDEFNWEIPIVAGETVQKVESNGDSTFKIAHLTDIHYDPRYTEGKSFDCNEPLCCQDDQSDATDDKTACGYWTSYKKSDVPLRLIQEAVDEINKQEIDYIYFTGDIVSHRVWETSKKFNLDSISEIMDLFADKFKKPVYPILGNHETHPVNVYAPLKITDSDLSDEWLFDNVFDKWSKWLGSEVKETVKKGGYYTVSPKTGFRIIVLNNNVCQNVNWWNLYDDYDPYGQLQWLVETLKEAEDKKEIVHILAHIPNSHCMKAWGSAYNKIVDRFSNTIAAQFNGHSHKDQFHIFYDKNNKPNNIVINGGSLVTDMGNPNYKIYTVDSKGFDIMDSELYTFDLEEANKNKKLEWRKLYSYQENFGVKKLVASELDTLITKMSEDITNGNYSLINQYHNYYYRDSPTGKNNCDENCMKNYLCEIMTTVHGDTKCQHKT